MVRAGKKRFEEECSVLSAPIADIDTGKDQDLVVSCLKTVRGMTFESDRFRTSGTKEGKLALF